MNRYSILIIILLVSASCFSQKFDLRIDSLIHVEIQKLKIKGVDEIGYTKLTCINNGINTTAYLFWNECKNTHVQKFVGSEYDKNKFHKYQPLIITDSIYFTFFKANYDKLITEKVKPFSYQKESTQGNNPQTYIIIIDHSCYRNFNLYIKDTLFNKNFNYFDLREFSEDQIDNSKLSKERIIELNERGWDVDTTYKNNPIKNIYYKDNNELAIAKWDSLLSNFIIKLEFENEFIEIKN